MREIKVLLCLVLITMLTGCWNRKELNDLAICVGIGIDKAKNGYMISVQVVDPAEVAANKAKEGRSPVNLYTMTAPTIFEALRKMTTISPRRVYLSHTRILVLGEAIAREGITPVLDYISRDHEFRTDFYIVVAREAKAQDILKVMTPLEQIPANEMFSSLETSQKTWAPTAAVTLDQLIADLTSNGKEAVLTGVKVTGPKQKSGKRANVEQIDTPVLLEYTSLAAFRKDKLVGWLSETDSKGYNYIVGKVKSTVGHMRCKDGRKITLEVIRAESKIKAVMKNGKPEIEVALRVEDNVGEVECQIDLTKTSSINELEKEAEKRLEEVTMNTVKYAQQKMKADIFGFGDVIHKQYPKEWKKMRDKWVEEFPKLQVHVKTDVKIRRLGTINNAFKEK